MTHNHRRKISDELYKQVLDAYALALHMRPGNQVLDGLYDEAQVKRIRAKMDDESGYGRFDDFQTGIQYNVKVYTRRPVPAEARFIITLSKVEREVNDTNQ